MLFQNSLLSKQTCRIISKCWLAPSSGQNLPPIFLHHFLFPFDESSRAVHSRNKDDNDDNNNNNNCCCCCWWYFLLQLSIQQKLVEFSTLFVSTSLSLLRITTNFISTKMIDKHIWLLPIMNCLDFIGISWIQQLFKKMGQLRPLFRLFSVFLNKHCYNFYNK